MTDPDRHDEREYWGVPPEESDRKCLGCERYITRGSFCRACREDLFPDDDHTTMFDRMFREKP